MTASRWRTYALILQVYASFQAIPTILDLLGRTWGVIAATCLIPITLIGFLVPVTSDRTTGRHRVEE